MFRLVTRKTLIRRLFERIRNYVDLLMKKAVKLPHDSTYSIQIPTRIVTNERRYQDAWTQEHDQKRQSGVFHGNGSKNSLEERFTSTDARRNSDVKNGV